MNMDCSIEVESKKVFIYFQHGSTFGGNPIACKVAMAALDVSLGSVFDGSS